MTLLKRGDRTQGWGGNNPLPPTKGPDPPHAAGVKVHKSRKNMTGTTGTICLQLCWPSVRLVSVLGYD